MFVFVNKYLPVRLAPLDDRARSFYYMDEKFFQKFRVVVAAPKGPTFKVYVIYFWFIYIYICVCLHLQLLHLCLLTYRVYYPVTGL